MAPTEVLMQDLCRAGLPDMLTVADIVGIRNTFNYYQNFFFAGSL